jgi:hypothetical protein
MTALEQKILALVNQLEQLAAHLADPAAKAELPRVMALIDGLSAELPGGTDPALLHYLRKRSYQKARTFLEGREAENAKGNCRHD